MCPYKSFFKGMENNAIFCYSKFIDNRIINRKSSDKIQGAIIIITHF